MTENKSKSDDANPKGSVVSEEEMAFYKKLFPSFDIITKRKIHCTVCRGHLGCAPGNEDSIKMHPVLRVMQCTDCHEFYSSGEFSRGEDGSELYCRWCGQGGQVYCCSSCPYVFCKSCIVENLNKGVVRDIEENDSWNCFSCSTKIIWPLRAMHWALTEYMAKEKRTIVNGNHSASEKEELLALDNSTCCKSKSTLNKSAVSSTNTQKRRATQSPQITVQPSKKTRSSLPMNSKASTPTSLSAMPNVLEPACQITTPTAPPPLVMQSHQMSSNVLNKPQQYRIPASIKQTVRPPIQRTTTLNRGVPTIQSRLNGPRSVNPGATSLGGGATTIRLSNNQLANQQAAQRRQISTITATTTNTSGPVYHTINGYRIDLNSASKQDNFRLPNGKLIQVKRQASVNPGAQPNQQASVSSTITSPTQTYSMNQYMRPQIRPSPQQIHPQHHQQQMQQQQMQQQQMQQQQIVIQRNPPVPQQFIIHTPPMQQPQLQQHPQAPPPTIQYRQVPQLQPANQNVIPPGVIGQQNIALKSIPTFVKQIFPSTPLGIARNTLQTQLFHTMEICHHLMTKTHTLTNSNAYKSVHNLMDIKELYIHLSYLLTYAIGRFKGLQDKCLNDMKALGFTQEARNLERGQLAKDNSTNHNDDDLAIVEPQRDTIELDSDVEDDIPRIKIEKQDKHTMESTLNSLSMPNTSNYGSNSDSEDIDLNVAADLLAGMLEVELTEGDPSELRPPKAKLPRTKTTKRKQRPNSPTTQAERAKIQALQSLKDSDAKLKMNCKVVLERMDVPSSPESEEKKDSTKTSEPPAESEKAAAEEKEKAEEPKELTQDKEKVIESDSAEKSGSNKEEPSKEKVIELDSADEEKTEKNDDGKKDEPSNEDEKDKPSEDSDKVTVIDLDDEKNEESKKDKPSDEGEKDEPSEEGEKDKPSEDSDKMSVIDLDDEEDKTENTKETEKSPSKPSDNEVIDLDDDDETDKDKTKSPEKSLSEEVINLDDDDDEKNVESPEKAKKDSEEKMDVDEEEDPSTNKDEGKTSEKEDGSKDTPEKASDVFEISEDEEEITSNEKNSEKEKVNESTDEPNKQDEEKTESEVDTKLDDEEVEENEPVVEVSIEIIEDGDEQSKENSKDEAKQASEDEAKQASEDEAKQASEDEAKQDEVEDDVAKEGEIVESIEGESTESKVIEGSKADDSEVAVTNEEETVNESVSSEKEKDDDTSNDKQQNEINDDQEENKTDIDSKNSDDLSQSTEKHTDATNSNGKVYVDGKELDENDFESSSSSSEDEEESKTNSAPIENDIEMKDLECKETQSNGFGSENSSSNFDLIESMIKENLSASPDKSKIEESNNGILATTANEV